MAFLISVFWTLMLEARASPWFERVPGVSNVVDDPSRLKCDCMATIDESQKVEPTLGGPNEYAERCFRGISDR